MKIITIFFILLAALQIKSNKLEVAVENEKENILTLGVDNPLTALIESTSKKDVALTTNNGIIEKAGGNRFIIRPAIVGVAIVNVCKLVKQDTVIIDKREFRVRAIPDPFAMVGISGGGRVNKKVFIAQGGIRVKIGLADIDAPLQVAGYTIIAINDSGIIGTRINIGAAFTDKTIELLKQLKPNDRLIVCKLVAKLPAQKILLHPLEFIIED